MSQPYSALKAQVKRTIWPTQGPPEFISEDGIDRFFVDGLVEMQKWVPCLRQRHESVLKQCSTYFNCGKTLFDAPKGRIRKLYTVWDDGYCDPVTYDMATLDEVNAWSRRFMLCGEKARPSHPTLPALPLGIDYPAQSTDNAFGRALSGLWAIDNDRIVMAPWIQSDEQVVLEWAGLKRTYADADLVSDDPMFERTLRWFVKMSFEQMYGTDTNLYAMAKAAYDEALSELLHECNEETKLRVSRQSTEERYALLDCYDSSASIATTPFKEVPLVFAAIGDYGSDGTPEADVAALVKAWTPSFVLALGDNNYPSGAAATIDANVGKHYRKFIYPYTGSQPLGSGETAATVNAFWPVVGNHDLDTVVSGVAGKPFYDYFTALTADHYDFVVGNVHFFAINSGYNTAGVDVSSFGSMDLSPQADQVRYRVAQSTSKWKVAFMHHPYRTSGLNYAPGKAALLWVQDLAVDAVLCGHSHAFEAIQPSGKPALFISGNGGKDLVGKSATVDPAETFFSAADFGALRLTSLCASLKAEFITRTGSILKTITLTK